MKKFFLSLLMLATLTNAFAQMTPEEKAALKAAQKEAKSQVSKGIALRDEVNVLYQGIQAENAKGAKANQDVIARNTENIKIKSLEANDLLMKALSSGHVAEKQMFEACKALDETSSHLLNPELNKAAQKESFDTLAFSKAIDGVCKGCYGVLTYGNKKDDTQKISIMNSELKMPKLMTYYAYLCIFYTETKNVEGAVAALDKYVSFATDYPKVADDEQVKNPQYPASQFGFNIYLTAYNLKQYDICEKYYNLALQYPDEQSHNFVIGSRPQMYKAQGNTAKWEEALLEIVDQEPNSQNAEVAIQNLLAHYGQIGPKEMSDFADRMLEKYPENKIANYGKGYSLFAQEKYEASFPYYQKSIEIDPNYIDGTYMCGMSLYRQALENYYQYIDNKKYKSTAEMNSAEEKYVKTYFRRAKTYFETCRELAPTKSDDWAGPLQNIYKNLGEKEKAAEMAEYLK